MTSKKCEITGRHECVPWAKKFCFQQLLLGTAELPFCQRLKRKPKNKASSRWYFCWGTTQQPAGRGLLGTGNTEMPFQLQLVSLALTVLWYQISEQKVISSLKKNSCLVQVSFPAAFTSEGLHTNNTSVLSCWDATRCFGSTDVSRFDKNFFFKLRYCFMWKKHKSRTFDASLPAQHSIIVFRSDDKKCHLVQINSFSMS